MNDRKETIVLFVFVVVFISTVFLLCSGRSTVRDLRERAEPIRAELNNARKEQQKQSETLAKAERATGTSRERVEDSKRFNQEIADTERENAEIIAECQSILRAVRARGGKENQNQSTAEKFMDSSFHWLGNIGDEMTFEKAGRKIKKDIKK